MAGEVKVTLIKSDKTSSNINEAPIERTIEEPISDLGMPVVGKIVKYATMVALAKAAYDLAKKSYERINTIELEARVIEDSLRNYGGAGFSANTIGDRFDVFGKRIDGESVAYKR